MNNLVGHFEEKIQKEGSLSSFRRQIALKKVE